MRLRCEKRICVLSPVMLPTLPHNHDITQELMAAGAGKAATVTALFSLAGQAGQAATGLYTFLKSYKSIHPRVGDAAQEIDHLHVFLGEIWRAASLTSSGAGPPPPSLAAIFASLERCYNYMKQLESDLDSVKIKARESVVKKLKIAAEKDYFLNISLQLSFHRQEPLQSYCCLEHLPGQSAHILYQRLGTTNTDIELQAFRLLMGSID
jgi:hypothetical protein